MAGACARFSVDGLGCEYSLLTPSRSEVKRVVAAWPRRAPDCDPLHSGNQRGGWSARSQTSSLDRHLTPPFLCMDDGDDRRGHTTIVSPPAMATSSSTRSGALEVIYLVVIKAGVVGRLRRMPPPCSATNVAHWASVANPCRSQGSLRRHIPFLLSFFLFFFFLGFGLSFFLMVC